uniref:Uncharacterized protein n=1 Tax=Acidithiobacillus ferrianus TaxID=2678518 RepID=A0A845U365_9PROT|nr:hypothetical protein [Acidithiobacillus ferrianus]NDU42062.1 hypothetical protein [Acidithiobacillus ferrianus]
MTNSCALAREMPNPAFERDAAKARRPSTLRSRALRARERGASVEHRGVGRTAPANPSFERTPLRGFARVSLRALRALRPYAGAAQLAPR